MFSGKTENEDPNKGIHADLIGRDRQANRQKILYR
jgi:hypothetical protein